MTSIGCIGLEQGSFWLFRLKSLGYSVTIIDKSLNFNFHITEFDFLVLFATEPSSFFESISNLLLLQERHLSKIIILHENNRFFSIYQLARLSKISLIFNLPTEFHLFVDHIPPPFLDPTIREKHNTNVAHQRNQQKHLYTRKKGNTLYYKKIHAPDFGYRCRQTLRHHRQAICDKI